MAPLFIRTQLRPTVPRTSFSGEKAAIAKKLQPYSYKGMGEHNCATYAVKRRGGHHCSVTGGSKYVQVSLEMSLLNPDGCRFKISRCLWTQVGLLSAHT
jgi:hypothetical protein